MNPSLAIIVFTTLAGSAQGLAAALVVAMLSGVAPATGFTATALLLAEALLGLAQGAAFMHLGRPARAWRAAAMWRTSWMSREVIALPALMAAAAAWALLLRLQWPTPLAALPAWGARVLALRRNAGLVPHSTPQTATGLRGARVVQLSMGLTGGSHNTREFFHRASPRVFHAVKPLFLLGAFALPALLLLWAGRSAAAWPWVLAVALQTAGLLAERWYFFAQARHPQNLYYQGVA